jgi:hypothetical protein
MAQLARRFHHKAAFDLLMGGQYAQ